MASNITIKDIAAAAGVSTATVSRALNDSSRVDQSTKLRIQQIADDMGYQVNNNARSIRLKKTFTIGVVISNILTSFFAEIMDELEVQASQNDYQIIIARTNEDAQSEQKAVTALRQRMIDGLIIATADDSQLLKELSQDTPTVFIDRIPQGQTGNFDTVLSENTKGAFDIVNTMINHGAQRIGFISSPVLTTSSERLNGYQQSLEQAQFPLDERLILTSTADYQNVEDLTSKLIYNFRCDGIIAADNQILLKVLKYFANHQITSITLGSFDDSPWLPLVKYPMVIAKQSTNQIAKTAFHLLLERMKEPNKPATTKRINTTIVTYQ